jgi:hypothetical protein
MHEGKFNKSFTNQLEITYSSRIPKPLPYLRSILRVFHEKACQQENPFTDFLSTNESRPSRFHPHSLMGPPFAPVHGNIRE